MLTQEPARLDLLRGLEDVLGEERATTLMSYLPSTQNVATHDDFRRFEVRMDDRFAAFEQRMDDRFAAMEQRMDERFAAMERRMDERFAAMDERFAAMERRMDERFAAMDERFAAIDERFAAMDEQTRERIDSVRSTVNERYTSLEYQIRTGDADTATALHKEMSRLITTQTRIIVFGLVGALAANISLVLLTA